MTPVTDKTDSVEEVSVWPEHASALPWTYHRQLHAGQHWDRIEDAHGNTVVEHVGHIDGPAICAAVNSRRSIANTAEGVRVKPLEWYADDDSIAFVAHTVVGRYAITQYPGMEQPYRLFCPSWMERKPFTSLSEAKAAAQADYEQRIRSALTSPPADHFADAGNMVETPPAGAVPEGPVEDLAGPAARRLFQYTRTFNAIAAATSQNAAGIGISVRAFIKAFGPIDLDIASELYLHAPEHNDVRVTDDEVNSAEIEWEIHDDNDRAPRDFWHARINWRGLSSDWVQWGDLGQYREPVPAAEKLRVENELRADLRAALSAALKKAGA